MEVGVQSGIRSGRQEVGVNEVESRSRGRHLGEEVERTHRSDNLGHGVVMLRVYTPHRSIAVVIVHDPRWHIQVCSSSWMCPPRPSAVIIC